MHADNVRDFALAVSPSYTIDYGQSGSGVALELYTSGVGEGTRQDILAWTADALDQLAELIGPYPYATFRIADAGPTMPGGIEFPGLIYINPAYGQLDRLIYHEVAHQWLYGIIGTRTLQDGWIDEGGAEFFERGLPTGCSEVPPLPAGGYALWLDASYEELPDDPERNWYFSIYEQGARFYAEVKATMGDDAFWAAFRDIYAEHAFGIVTAWDVLATWQLHSPTDLRPLYNAYFRYDWIDSLPG
jgi:aminopeptidase N